MTDDLTKRAQAVLTADKERVDLGCEASCIVQEHGAVVWTSGSRMEVYVDLEIPPPGSDEKPEFFVRAPLGGPAASIIAAYMQRDAEQRAEIERLRTGIQQWLDVRMRDYTEKQYGKDQMRALLEPSHD